MQRPWGKNDKRESRLVVIGRNLPRAELEAGFQSCLVE
ncbi:GTP-binding protein [Acinetobacter baumannii]